MHWKTETLAFAFVVAALSGHATASRGEESTDPSRFTYARLYCGPDGNTHFQDATAELRKTDFAPPAPPIHIGSDFPASRAFFGGFDARWGTGVFPSPTTTVPPLAVTLKSNCEKSYGMRMQPWLAG